MKRTILMAACVALGAAWSGAAKADLVTNGGFETGDFTGWTTSGDVGIDSTFPYSGSYDAFFGSPSGTISQSLVTTAGTSYDLSFAVWDENASSLDSFTVSLGGFSATITGDTAPSYTVESFVVPGSDITGESTLSFTGSLNTTSFTTSFADWNLDSVSVYPAAVPEPPAALLFAAALAIGGAAVGAARRTRRS